MMKMGTAKGVASQLMSNSVGMLVLNFTKKTADFSFSQEDVVGTNVLLFLSLDESTEYLDSAFVNVIYIKSSSNGIEF